jgi:hypothetical protein
MGVIDEDHRGRHDPERVDPAAPGRRNPLGRSSIVHGAI